MENFLDSTIMFFSFFYALLIVIVHILNAVWTVQLIILYNKEFGPNRNMWLKGYRILVSLGMASAFLYVLITLFTPYPFEATIFAVMVIRPLIFMSGCVMAANAYLKVKELLSNKR